MFEKQKVVDCVEISFMLLVVRQAFDTECLDVPTEPIASNASPVLLVDAVCEAHDNVEPTRNWYDKVEAIVPVERVSKNVDEALEARIGELVTDPGDSETKSETS